MENIIECIFFSGISLFGFIMWLKIFIKKRKYEKISSVVTHVKKDWVSAGDSISNGAHCEYEYIYAGKKYQIQDKLYESSAKLKIGDNVEIYVDKNNPNRVLTPANIKYQKIYFLCLVFGILAIFVF